MSTKFGIFFVFMSPKESSTQQNGSPLTTILILHVTLILFLPTKGISVEQCCRMLEVPEICVRTLCNPGLPPSDFAVYDIFERRNNCSMHLNPIAKCLAAGRDNFSCCSKEAKDSDVNSCFGLCRGDADIPPSNSYQTCIAINLGTMFACFEKGYRKSPSQPKNLIIEDLGATELVLSWEEPEFNAPLVDHYLLLIYELETGSKLPDLETELRIETVNKNARITLEPGTRYLVQVIALGISNENAVNIIEELNYPKSLPTEIRFKTLGIAPQVTPLKDTVCAALNSNTVIACRIRISRGSTRVDPEIRWEHKHIGHFHPIRTSERFISDHYNFSRFRPREILATLEIKAIKSHDQGYYKCKVSDDFGHSEATVHLLIVSRYEPQATPPKTPLECCKDLGVEQRCLSMCGSNEVEQKMKYIPRPFMNQNCSGEISKVLSCAMPNVDESACCISNKMPSQCLYLCDHQIKPSNLMPINCLGYVHTVEKCRLEGLQYRPGFVANLKINKTLDNLISINFDSSERADIHFIYWRFQNGNWQQRSLNNSSTKLYPPVDEIVILASNPFGYSPPSRIKFLDGNWIRA